MASVTEHVVTAATWEYVTAEGKRRRAFFGEVVLLTDEEAERGFAVGALGVEAPAEDDSTESDSGEDESTESDSGESDPGVDASDAGDSGDSDDADTGDAATPDASDDKDDDQLRADGRPLKVARHPVLVDWLMAHGTYDRGELEAQEKDDLWALIEATD
ncbi:hypothetical protein [Mycobacteroides chelonae]|uniref:hypothetical protein n=1 Tax=Mycobacteroides chelonae TaxID=1774 RepID=UPI0018B0A209|nr:hypothetical protein [Mycobacteroides chelonae]MBF9328485.1 hypothetical protein [Mycobacteroides chelonae]MBF9422663.1 hypothetical protein [Mycobacteroides chelonae]